MPVTVAITMLPVALWTFGEARPEAVEDDRRVQGVAEVSSEVNERARACGVENDSAADVESRRKGSERQPQRGRDRSILCGIERTQTDGLIVFNHRQVHPTVGRHSRAQRGHEGSHAGAKLVLVEFDAAAEMEEVAKQGCGGIHSDAPRKRIRPLIESSTVRFSKALIPMTAAEYGPRW